MHSISASYINFWKSASAMGNIASVRDSVNWNEKDTEILKSLLGIWWTLLGSLYEFREIRGIQGFQRKSWDFNRDPPWMHVGNPAFRLKFFVSCKLGFSWFVVDVLNFGENVDFQLTIRISKVTPRFRYEYWDGNWSSKCLWKFRDSRGNSGESSGFMVDTLRFRYGCRRIRLFSWIRISEIPLETV